MTESFQSIINSINNCSRKISLAIGVFDGLHLGHQKIIQTLLKNNGKTLPGCLTFWPNPATVIRPDRFLGNILTLDLRKRYLSELGVEETFIVDFSREFSKINGADFISSLLETENISTIVVGEDFRCGKNNDTDTEKLQSVAVHYDVEVLVVQSKMSGNSKISSTRIRQAVLNGDMGTAYFLLGKHFCLDVSDRTTIRSNDMSCVNIDGCVQIKPPDGRYRCIVHSKEESIETELIINKNLLEWVSKELIPATKIEIGERLWH